MGGGNGAKAKQARERNAKAAGGVAKSQLKINESAKSLKCIKCFQTFLQTANEKMLSEHAENKHKGMGLTDCFPEFVSVA